MITLFSHDFQRTHLEQDDDHHGQEAEGPDATIPHDLESIVPTPFSSQPIEGIPKAVQVKRAGHQDQEGYE